MISSLHLDAYFMLVEGAVSWKSVEQTLTTTLTMEAEYITCYEATHQSIWLKKTFFEHVTRMDVMRFF